MKAPAHGNLARLAKPFKSKFTSRRGLSENHTETDRPRMIFMADNLLGSSAPTCALIGMAAQRRPTF